MNLKHFLKTLDQEAHLEALEQYLDLLEKWNKSYNLTGVKDRAAMVNKHLKDSLMISPWLKGDHILDVGTGAGLPGIPLAILNPEKSFVLMDSNGKKTRFLHEVKRQLILKNITIEKTRVEDYLPSHPFDTVLSRAFSHLNQMIQWTQHLLDHKGIWLAMKGQYPSEELEQVTFPYEVYSYTIEGMREARCCVCIHHQ